MELAAKKKSSLCRLGLLGPAIGEITAYWVARDILLRLKNRATGVGMSATLLDAVGMAGRLCWLQFRTYALLGVALDRLLDVAWQSQPMGRMQEPATT